MKLAKAYLCVQCQEIFDQPHGICPACTSSNMLFLDSILHALIDYKKLTDKQGRKNV